MYPSQNCEPCHPECQEVVLPAPPECIGEPCVEITLGECVRYTGVAIPCLNIANGENLNSIISKISAKACEEPPQPPAPIAFEGLNYVYVYGNGEDAEENGQQLLDGYQEAVAKRVLVNPTIDLGELTFTSGMGWYSSTFPQSILEPYITNGQLQVYGFMTLSVVGDGTIYDCYLQPTMGGYYLSGYGMSMPPNGDCSITNFYQGALKSTLVVGPGYYEIDGEFLINEQYVDIVSLTGNMDVNITNTTGDVALRVDTDYVYLKGLNVNSQTFEIANSYNNNKYEKCKGGDYSFGSNDIDSLGEFIDCQAGQYSFGSLGGNANGLYINCTAENNSFGGSDNIALMSNAYGYFKNCIANGRSFGTEEAAGTFIDCISLGDASFGGGEGSVIGIASGYFTRCESGNNSFGGNNGIANGTFTDCKGYDFCFGRDITSGYFYNCVGQNYCFGGTTVSGYFDNCQGNDYCFGWDSTAVISGQFKNCVANYKSYGASYGTSITGTFEYCEGGDECFGTSSIECFGYFKYCFGNQGCFAGFGGLAGGTFENCVATGFAFGGGFSDGSATGFFTNCSATNNAFGTTLANGTFINCKATAGSFAPSGSANGTFINCVAGGSSFGDIASGSFTNCIADDNSFGEQIASGIFINCVADENSFGFQEASGKFTNCIGKSGCFGFGAAPYVTGVLTGQLYYCQLLTGTFQTVSGLGITRYCIDGSNATNNQ